MERLSEELEKEGIASIFIYANEAHPSENFPHHTSFEQKVAQAQEFQKMFNIQRPILIDNLDGTCHRAYGSMPNMTWILDRRGHSFYKADWTRDHSIRSALQGWRDMLERRRTERTIIATFEVRRLEYRIVDRHSLVKHLEQNGPRAVAEYIAQSEEWGRDTTKIKEYLNS